MDRFSEILAESCLTTDWEQFAKDNGLDPKTVAYVWMRMIQYFEQMRNNTVFLSASPEDIKYASLGAELKYHLSMEDVLQVVILNLADDWFNMQGDEWLDTQEEDSEQEDLS